MKFSIVQFCNLYKEEEYKEAHQMIKDYIFITYDKSYYVRVNNRFIEYTKEQLNEMIINYLPEEAQIWFNTKYRERYEVIESETSLLYETDEYINIGFKPKKQEIAPKKKPEKKKKVEEPDALENGVEEAEVGTSKLKAALDGL